MNENTLELKFLPKEDKKSELSILTTNQTNPFLRNVHEQENILFKHESFEINSCIYTVNKKL